MDIDVKIIVNQFAVAVTIISWIIFFFGFLILKRGTVQSEKKRNRSAVLGFILQAIGYAFVFGFRREFFSDIILMSVSVTVILAIINFCLASFSLWIALTAVKTLGKQWDMRARIIEGHELIVSGPYKIVRHPIYSGMFGLLIITGFSLSQLWALLVATIFYFIGTICREKVEEGLLIQHFGEKYFEYKKVVPAIIPFIY